MKQNKYNFETSVPIKWGKFRLKNKMKKFYKVKHKYIKRYSKKLNEKEIQELENSFLDLKNTYKKEKDKDILRKQFIETKKTLHKYLPDTLNRASMEFVESLIYAIIIVFFLRAFIMDTYHIPTGSMIPTILPGDRIFASKFIYGFSIPWTNFKFANWNFPENGDIIIFEPPSKKYDDFQNIPGTIDNFVKRMLAKEGDSIEIKNNIIYLNSKPIERKLINEKFFFMDKDQREKGGKASTGMVYEEKLGNNKYVSITTNGPFDYFGVDKNNKLTIQASEIVGAFKVPKDHFFLLSDNRDLIINNNFDSRFLGPIEKDNIIGKKEIGNLVLVEYQIENKKYSSNLRIVAQEGNTIEMKNKILYVDGKAINFKLKNYISKNTDKKYYLSEYTEKINDKEYSIYWSISSTANFGVDKFGNTSFSVVDIPAQGINKIVKPYIVPKGYVFAIGDNRDGSFDSRFWGPVPKNNIKGAPMIIWFSSYNWIPRLKRFFNIFWNK